MSVEGSTVASVRSVSETDLDEALTRTGILLLDLWSEACGPCKAMAPAVARIAEQVRDRATVVALNLDDHPAVVGRFQVTTLPTMVVFVDGQEHSRLLGVQTERDMVAAVEAADR